SPSITTACLSLAESSTVNILPAPPCRTTTSRWPSRTGTLLRRDQITGHSRFSGTLCLRDLYSRTKTKSPRTNGIAERFHKTVLDEFYRIAFRKRLYASIGDLQDDLDLWVKSYNEERPHQGRWCFGKTPLQTFLDAIPIAREKTIAA